MKRGETGFIDGSGEERRTKSEVQDRSVIFGLNNYKSDVLFFFFFESEFRSCYPGWSAMAQSRLTATSASWVQAIPLP